MANPLKGDVSLNFGGTSYKLRFSINAIASMEFALGKNVGEISYLMGDKNNPSMTVWRAALWAALQKHHPEINLMVAGDIIEEVGLPLATEKVSEAMSVAFPSAEDDGAKDKKAGTENPPKAGPRRGTGKPSKKRTPS